MHIYLSGPMTGLPDLNYPAFRAAAEHLRAVGHTVYNPSEWEERYNKGVFNHKIAFADYCTYIAREATHVVVLPGWIMSSGSCAEVALAFAIGTPVLQYGATPMRELNIQVTVEELPEEPA